MYYVYKIKGIPIIEQEDKGKENLMGIRTTLDEAEYLCDDCMGEDILRNNQKIHVKLKVKDNLHVSRIPRYVAFSGKSQVYVMYEGIKYYLGKGPIEQYKDKVINLIELKELSQVTRYGK